MRDRAVLVGPRATAYGRLCPGGQGARWTERTPIPVTDIFDELQWRGLVAQTTDEAALREALAEGPITLYCGFDPSAPSLHFGNLVQLVVLRHMQAAGHRVICLVGGSTGLIGDPKPDAERVLQDKDTSPTAVSRIQQLVGPFLDFEGDNAAVLVNNLDWTAPMSALDFLRDIGKHFRVNQMIRKDAVAARLESDAGHLLHRVQLPDAPGARLPRALPRATAARCRPVAATSGATSPPASTWSTGSRAASVHALTTPLLTDSRGRSSASREGNAVWLSADMTSPYAFYQYWLNVEDASVVSCSRSSPTARARRSPSSSEQVAEEPFRRAAQKALAADVTTLVHGADATAAVQAASEALFGKGDLGGSGRARPSATRRRSCRVRGAPSGRPSSTRWWPWAWSTRATPPGGRSGRAGPRSTT